MKSQILLYDIHTLIYFSGKEQVHYVFDGFLTIDVERAVGLNIFKYFLLSQIIKGTPIKLGNTQLPI